MAGLYALGSNGSGQLGLGHKEDVSVPKPVIFHCAPPSDPIVKIAAGGNHTIILTSSGEAYWTGDSSNGACGVTTIATADNAKFEELILSDTESLGPIVHIACTWASSTFVVRDKHGQATKLYSCGIGDNGVLGFEATGVVEPKLIPNFPPSGTEVVHLASGLAHVVAVLDNGEVYGWGNGKKGQLGQAVSLEGNTPPVPIILCAPCRIGISSGLNFKVVTAVCGQYSTCLFGDAAEGNVLFLGPDRWGLKSTVLSPVRDWVKVSGTWSGVYSLTRDGALSGSGRDDHGQLPPPNLPRLKDFVTGSEHIVALTEDGDVIAWGWGEHGNCGPRTDGRFGVVKGRWNVIASTKNLAEGCYIATLGAGCATSWIYVHAEGIYL